MRPILLLPILTLCAAAPAASQAILVPVRCKGDCPAAGALPRALPADTARVWAQVERGMATTSVHHTFRNETGGVIDGALFFPLPADAEILHVVVYPDSGELTQYDEWNGDDESRWILEGMARERPRSGLRAYLGRRVLHAPVLDIPARGRMTVRIEYTQRLRETGEGLAYTYPLSAGGDAPPIGGLSLGLQIRTEAGFRAVSSPSHDVSLGWGSESVRCPPTHRCGYRGATSQRIRVVRMRGGRETRRKDFHLVYVPTPPGAPDAVSAPRDSYRLDVSERP
ncbi:MAG TPA: hypothetical protein VFR81_11195 [Longimicrobium sp.]|nr:hypothetical protein [Longimicrobium sp.]